jgi:hypothetical protein
VAFPTSKRKRILDAVVARLAVITVANGFGSNAGDSIKLGDNPQLGPDDRYPCIAVLVEDDTIGNQQARIVIDLSIQIAVIVPIDLADSTWPAIEEAVSDVKRAMELVDRSLSGLLRYNLERRPTRIYPRESGSTVAGVTVGYLLPYHETWGEPEA